MAASLATILLLAVTVLIGIAATAAFRHVAAGNERVPTPVQFLPNESQDQLVVAVATKGATWNHIGFRLEQLSSGAFGLCIGNEDDATPDQLHDERPAASCVSGNNRLTVSGREVVRIAEPPNPIRAHSFVEFCGEAAVGQALLRIIDLEVGAVIANPRLGPIRACNG